MKKLNRERGITFIMTAISLSVLLGFAAFATDIGMMLHQQREAQSAADSAAVAAATTLSTTGNYSMAETVGLTDAAQNGYNVGTTNTCPITTPATSIEVCIQEPVNDPNTAFNKAGFVEADIIQPSSTPLVRAFMSMIGNSGFSGLNVSARAVAVAGGGSNPTGCIYVTDPTASDAMDLQGSFTVSAPDCAININSNSSTALQFTGAGGSLTAGTIGVVGDDHGQTGDASPAPVTGIPQFTDPLDTRDLEAEMPQLTANCTPYTPGQAITMTPFTPAGGQVDNNAGSAYFQQAYPVYHAVCYSGTVNLSNFTATNPLPSGVYVFTGAVTLSNVISAGSTITTTVNGVTTTTTVPGTGVTLVIADGGSLNVAPGAGETMNLTAPLLDTGNPTSDDDLWNGMLIYQPPSNTNQLTLQIGSSSANLTGIIDASTAQLFLNDSGGDNKGTCTNGGVCLTTNLIVGTLYDKTATLSMTSYSKTQNTGTGVFTRTALVE